ncbi:MAG: ABC transporter ATP-binding protein [Patescibacteria group bacterium]
MQNNTQNNILAISHITHEFPQDERNYMLVLNDVSFSAQKGEFLSLLGPSGAGKSTLLRVIAGLEKPTFGEVERNTEEMTMVFQHYALFPWLTAEENVGFGLRMKGLSEKEWRRVAKEKMAEVGLGGMGHVHPKELSGGMRQRVGIARALSMSPDLLLLDEPFSNLDSITATFLKKDLLEIWKKYKMTIIMVNHLIEDAVELSNRILVFSGRPARIKKEFALKTPRPRDTRKKAFYTLNDEITALLAEEIQNSHETLLREKKKPV